jgi:hypothetical protein
MTRTTELLFTNMLLVFCVTQSISQSATDTYNCSCVSASTNLITNPSFESNTSGWDAEKGTLVRNDDYRSCGYYGVYLDHTTTGTATISQKVMISTKMPIGANITFSVYSGTHTNGLHCSPKVYLKYYNSANQEIASPGESTPITRNVDVSPVNVLALYSVTGTIPANTAYIRVGGSITCDYVKFDGACLKVNCLPANAGIDGILEVCDNALAQINLNDVITEEQLNGVWTLNDQPVNPIFTPSNGSSTNVYTYTIHKSTPCVSDFSTATVKVYKAGIVAAGPDGEVCTHVENEEIVDETTGLTKSKKYQLTGTSIGVGSVFWTADLPGGTFDDPTQLNTKYTPPIGATSIVLTLTSNDPEGPCGPISSSLTLKTIACAGILDPCSCNSVTYNQNEILEVKDFIEVDGTPGQTWTLVQNGGGANPLNGGQPYGTMQGLDTTPPFTTTNVDLPIGAPGGAVLTEVSPGKYRIDFAHDSGKGYIATVRNTTLGNTGGQELSVFNYCTITTFTPNVNIMGTLCDNAGKQSLSSFIQDPTPPTVGVISYSYSINGGPATEIGTEFDPIGLAGTSVKILAKYTPEAGNIIDCELLREATGLIAINECALPLNLISFNGKATENGIILNWKTTNEENFSHFELQKTDSGTEFNTIANIKSNNSKFYNHLDLNTYKSNNYYRIKMIDLDGKINYSKVINIVLDQETNFMNITNPVLNNEIIISSDIKKPRFSLFTATGSLIETSSITNGQNRYVVKPKNNISGVFFLKIINENSVITKKLILK